MGRLDQGERHQHRLRRRLFAGILRAQVTLNGVHMRYASLLTGIATLAAMAASLPSQAHERWPVIPWEIGVGPPPARYAWIPFRCSDGPAYNFYHNAWYAGQPPALYRGYAYRPYYRYTAYRVVPRTYLCSE